jgi:hypothetical protein
VVEQDGAEDAVDARLVQGGPDPLQVHDVDGDIPNSEAAEINGVDASVLEACAPPSAEVVTLGAEAEGLNLPSELPVQDQLGTAGIDQESPLVGPVDPQVDDR